MTPEKLWKNRHVWKKNARESKHKPFSIKTLPQKKRQNTISKNRVL